MKRFIAIAGALALSLTMLCACDNSSRPADSTDYADVFIFMGQSNMAGRGDYTKAVTVGEGHAYEFRAVTNPTRLYPLAEPFGVNENVEGGANDGTKKIDKGGLVSAFCEYYWRETGVPVIAISCSQGGTKVGEWQSGLGKLEDAQTRLQNCLYYMYSQETYTLRHVNMVWLQGESDAPHITKDEYSEKLNNVIDGMVEAGVENCFIIQIGNYMASVNQEYHDLYLDMHKIQSQFCEENDRAVLASIKLAGMPESMMHLNNHYVQSAYNIVGKDAGTNVAHFIKTGMAPVCKPYSEADVDPATQK